MNRDWRCIMLIVSIVFLSVIMLMSMAVSYYKEDNRQLKQQLYNLQEKYIKKDKEYKERIYRLMKKIEDIEEKE